MINIGGNIDEVYVGSAKIAEAYVGNQLVYRSGPEILPYDAEIEYLESTGTQWIDSGIKFANKLRITADALYTGRYTSVQILFGPSAGVGCWCGNVNNKKWGVANGGSGDSSTRTVISVWYQDNQTRLYINSSNVQTQPRRTTPTTNIGIFDAYTQGFKSSARIYEIIIQDVDYNYLFWGIPVRVGQIGYLYDKVSRELFGNSGTGDFVLGNDIT